MRYDSATISDAATRLAFDEAQRLDLVAAYHRRMPVTFSNADLHAVAHVIVENRLPRRALATDVLNCLRAEGLGRHEAIHTCRCSGGAILRSVRGEEVGFAPWLGLVRSF